MNKLIEAKVELKSNEAVLTLADSGQSFVISLEKLPTNTQSGDVLYLFLSPTNLSSDQAVSRAIINELLNPNSDTSQF